MRFLAEVYYKDLILNTGESMSYGSVTISYIGRSPIVFTLAAIGGGLGAIVGFKESGIVRAALGGAVGALFGGLAGAILETVLEQLTMSLTMSNVSKTRTFNYY